MLQRVIRRILSAIPAGARGPSGALQRRPHPGRGEAVGVLVPAVPGVGGGPLQSACRVRAVERQQFLHQLQVLDWAGLALPAGALPRRCPAGDGVHAELAVAEHVDLGVGRQHRERLYQRPQLHAVVGRVRLVAVGLRDDLAVLDPDHAPAAGAGVRHRAAVGEHAVVGSVFVLGQDLSEGEVLLPQGAAAIRAASAGRASGRPRDGLLLRRMQPAVLRLPAGILVEHGRCDLERRTAYLAGESGHGGRIR